MEDNKALQGQSIKLDLERDEPEQIAFALMQAFGMRGDAVASVEQVRRAAHRMGMSREAKVKWAIGFAGTDLTTITGADWVNFQLQLAAFTTPIVKIMKYAKDSEKLPLSRGSFPSKDEIERVHAQFNSLLNSFEGYGEISFEYGGETPIKTSVYLWQAEDGTYSISYEARDFVVKAMIVLTQLLADHGQRVRTCPEERHGCGKRFLTSRSDQIYCSTTCVSRATTRNRRERLRNAAKGAEPHAKR
jgi:hypothetical protein